MNFENMPIESLVAAIKNGTITAREVVDTCIARQASTKDLHAFTVFRAEEARIKAEDIDSRVKRGENVGGLAGIPFSVKDNIFTKGITTTAASNALKGFVPTVNARVVQRLLDEDAILIGKANMHELAFGITSLNGSYGFVKNPHDPTKIAGGSSGGTAVSVAVRSTFFGLGTDTGGSIRIPPALTGLLGFRPTIENYPTDGIINLSKTRDTPGVIAGSVEDVVYLNAILALKNPLVKPRKPHSVRLGFPYSYYRENMSTQVAEILNKAVVKLKSAGIEIVEEDIAGIEEINTAASFPVVFYETRQALSVLLKTLPKPVSESCFIENIGSPDVKELLQLTFGEKSRTSKNAYDEAIGKHRKQLLNAMKNYFEQHRLQALMFPLTVVEATDIRENHEGNITLNGKQVPSFATYIQNTDPGSNANMPGITIPMGKTQSGLPVGLGIDALSGDDGTLLSIAQTINTVLQT